MANASIKAFMRNKAKEEEVVDILAPESFVDENGERVVMKVKRLSTKHVNDVYSDYNYPVTAKDEKGNFIVQNGRVVKDFYSDPEGQINRLMVDALVFPDLHDPELMKFYNCVDVMDMPHAVFASKNEYEYVRDAVLSLASTLSGEESDYIVKEAKN